MRPSEALPGGMVRGQVVRGKERAQALGARVSSRTSSLAIVARCAGSSVPSRCAGSARGIIGNRHGRVARSQCCMGLIRLLISAVVCSSGTIFSGKVLLCCLKSLSNRPPIVAFFLCRPPLIFAVSTGNHQPNA